MTNNKWLTARINHQKNRELLLGGDSDPLRKKAKCLQKDLKERCYQSSSDDASRLYSSMFTKQAYRPTSTSTVQQLSSDSVGQQIMISDHLVYQNASTSISSFPSQFVQSKEEKKKKKEKKKTKKKKQKVMLSLSDNLQDTDHRNGNLLAEMMKFTRNIVLEDEDLWLYHEDDGCFHLSNYNQIAKAMRSSLDYEDTLKLTSRDYKESFQQLLISEELTRKDGFLQNRPFVNCLNGVVDVVSRKLLEHSPEFMFRHCVQAQYEPNYECPKFLEYVDFITGGDKELVRLLQVMMGYIWSSYTNGRVALLIYGVSGTGKSVLCNLIGRVLGEAYLSHTDLSLLQKPEFVAALSGKVLNIAPDLKNEPLRDVGFFKSLVSHNDNIATRALYANPKTIRGGETKMLFSSNHLLEFSSDLGEKDIEAVFNRIIFFPYMNQPVDRKSDNKHLSDELYDERDGIFSWAMDGLRDYVKNGEIFPMAKASEGLKRMNMTRYCPERIFFETCLKPDPERYESVTAVKDAYEAFCNAAGVVSSRRGKITDYLEQQKVLKKIKTRVDDDGYKNSKGANIWYYEGVRMKEKYRV